MKKPRILVAEDDPDDQLLLTSAFHENGVVQYIDFVMDGGELMFYLHAIVQEGSYARYPDLIMLDLNMPGKNGKDTLREIKINPLFRNIPVIIFTTTNDDREVRQCYEMGANSYIVKPPSFGRMVDIVRSLLQYWLTTASIPGVSTGQLGKN